MTLTRKCEVNIDPLTRRFSLWAYDLPSVVISKIMLVRVLARAEGCLSQGPRFFERRELTLIFSVGPDPILGPFPIR